MMNRNLPRYALFLTVMLSIRAFGEDQPKLASGSQTGAHLSEDTTGTFTDYRDGHEYKWVQIGEQVWMAENLAWLPDLSIGDKGSKRVKHYYVLNFWRWMGSTVADARATKPYQVYGVLYNWPAAVKGACPEGWHLPGDKEWATLENYLGPDAGNRLKIRDTSLWQQEVLTGKPVGFNAADGGLRMPGGLLATFASGNYIYAGALFWTATPENGSKAWARRIPYSSPGISRDPWKRNYGFSVRCIKDG